MSGRSRVGPGLTALAVLVALLALSVSLAQASLFLLRLGADDFQRILFPAVAAAIVIGSPVISRLVGEMVSARTSGAIVCLGAAVVLCAEAFSIGTSASGLSAGLIEAQRTENMESPEGMDARNAVTLAQRNVMDLQEQARSLPASWITRRSEISARADQALERLEAAQARAASIDVSTTGRALDAIESRTGMDAGLLTLLAAVMLSAVPATIFLSLGALSGRSKGPKPGKHHRQPGGE